MGRIFRGAAVALQRYGPYGNQQHDTKGYNKDPNTNRRLIGKILLPMSNDQEGGRSSQNEADQNYNHVPTIEHLQNIDYGCAIGFAQCNLFAAILRLPT